VDLANWWKALRVKTKVSWRSTSPQDCNIETPIWVSRFLVCPADNGLANPHAAWVNSFKEIYVILVYMYIYIHIYVYFFRCIYIYIYIIYIIFLKFSEFHVLLYPERNQLTKQIIQWNIEAEIKRHPYLHSTAIVFERTVLFSLRTHSKVFIHLQNRQLQATVIHHWFSNCLVYMQQARSQVGLGRRWATGRRETGEEE
jgi:hypothetical protein